MSVSLSRNIAAVCTLVGAQSTERESRRIIVAIAGPPASGKSTLAAAVVAELNTARPGAQFAALMTMDGFHLDNRILRARRLLDKKGAPETFDAIGFKWHLDRVRAADHDVCVPAFDRMRDLAIAQAELIPAELPVVVVEGNYLLLKHAPWAACHDAYDVTVYLDVAIAELDHRLVKRWLSHGYDRNAAQKKAQDNDIPNARLVLEQSVGADLMLSNGPA
ncbi:MAG: nucleoside/nucleotide kinase family protein [Pseudomonadota bacterium]